MSVIEPQSIISNTDSTNSYHTVVEPTAEELVSLSITERACFRFTHRMNQGTWKRLWTFVQSTLGAMWIHISTYNIMRLYGLENIEACDATRPILLVANHRSFFDMYAVSAMLFKRTNIIKSLYFPVRGRFFYEGAAGVLVNFIMGWFSMYPPFFYAPEKRDFDKYALKRLITLCREGAGNVIGFHPEGTRNKSLDPYSFLPPKPGIGKIILEARPQVIPVFITGLSNNLTEQVKRNWTTKQPIRIHFGAQLDLTEYENRASTFRAHKEIAEFVMSKIADLAEQDKALMNLPSAPPPPLQPPIAPLSESSTAPSITATYNQRS